jgi:uncharacterized protein (UPF0332 family)
LKRDRVFSSHSAVIAAFGKECAATRIMDPKFHRYLISSQNTRQIGDYGVENNVSSADAAEVISWAEEFLAEAISFLA